jgi:hypothetical protein
MDFLRHSNNAKLCDSNSLRVFIYWIFFSIEHTVNTISHAVVDRLGMRFGVKSYLVRISSGYIVVASRLLVGESFSQLVGKLSGLYVCESPTVDRKVIRSVSRSVP